MTTVTVDADPDVGRAQSRVCGTTRHEKHSVTGLLPRAHRGRKTRPAGYQAVGGQALTQPAAQTRDEKFPAPETHGAGQGIGQGIQLCFERYETDENPCVGEAEHAGAATPEGPYPRRCPDR